MTAQMDGARASAGALRISRAYIPEATTPDAAVLYFTAQNTGATPLVLTAVTTEGAASAAFESSVGAAGGGQQLTPIASLTIPGHSTVVLAPGHDLVALGHPNSLQQGITTAVTIDIAGAGSLTLQVPVVPSTGLQSNMPGMHMGN
jgi:copper(I)-binding protein